MKLWFILVLAAIDQFSKYLAIQFLAKRLEPIWLIPGYLALKYSPNKGAAFSMLSGYTVYLSLFTIAAVFMIGWLAWHTPRHQRWYLWGYNLILGGAVGNLIDRLVRGEEFLNGHVVDFVQFPWFINNLADDFICVGVAFWILGFFMYPIGAETEEGLGKAADEGTTEAAVGEEAKSVDSTGSDQSI